MDGVRHWATVFLLNAKPCLNVDLEYPSNPLDCFELLHMNSWTDTRETVYCAQQILENIPNQKLKSRANHWSDIYQNEIVKLLALFLCFFAKQQITVVNFQAGNSV